MALIDWQRRYDDLRTDLRDVAAAHGDVPDDRLVRLTQCLLDTPVHSELPERNDDVRAAYLQLRAEVRRVIFEATGRAVPLNIWDEEIVAVLMEQTSHPLAFMDAEPSAVSGVPDPDDEVLERIKARVVPMDDRM